MNLEELHEQLIIALCTNDAKKMRTVLEFGADVHYRKENALIVACTKGENKLIQILLEYGADLHCDDDYPLYTAMQYGHEETVRFLIKSGANIKNIKSDVKINSHFSISFIQYLLDCGLEINHSMFQYAVKEDLLDFFQFLYSRKDNVDLTSLLIMACISDAVNIFNYILDLDIEIDWTNEKLLQRVLLRDLSIIKKILNRIPNYEIFLKPGCLNIPCRAGYVEMVEFLLELGLDPNAADDWSWTSNFTTLEIATYCNCIDSVQLLLKYGATATLDSLFIAANTYGENWKLFNLIYQSKVWSKTELSDVLVEAVKNNSASENKTEPVIWQFLIDDIGFDLETSYLEKIVNDCLKYDRKLVMEYLINFYGSNVVQLVDQILDNDCANSIMKNYN